MIKVICELGINHFGSFDHCKNLINNAKSAEAWGIKFQYRNLKSYFKLLKKNDELGKEIIDIEIKKNYLTPLNIIKLSNYAKSIGLESGISFFDVNDIKDFKNYKFDFYKVPSVSALDFDLIKRLNKFKKKVFISLGSRSNNEILQNKKNFIKNSIKNQTIFFHCISNYPLNPLNANLGYISKLKNIFKGYEVGYSSHENDIFNCIIAISKGIKFIERHITIDKNSRGLDHSSSSDLNEIKKLCFYTRNYDLIANSKNNRQVNQGEKINLQNLGKSAYANKDININQKIKVTDISFLSPNIGLNKNEVLKFLDLKNKNFLRKGDPILITNFKKKKTLKKNSVIFCNNKKISIPIRPSDYKFMDNIFNINIYEFHLSFNDVLNFNFNNLDCNFLKKKKFSVHGPDYCDSNNILDLFSENKIVRKKSFKIFNMCLKISKYLQDLSGKQVLMIQSFSSIDPNLELEKRYKEIKKIIISSFKKYKIKVLPQWLPPSAWYFGGSSSMNLFSDPNDLKLLNRLKIKICLDISHFILSCNQKKIDLKFFFIKFKNLFMHYHISDASGLDGEGLSIGKGDLLRYKKILSDILNNKDIKVIESWQGHLNNGLIFINDISKLEKIIK